VPIVFGTVVILAAIGAMIWALMGPSAFGPGPSEHHAAQNDGGRAPMVNDIMAKAPKGPPIPVAVAAPVVPPPAPAPVATQVQAPPPRPPEPGMTATEIEGRRAAWQAYYTLLAQHRQDRASALATALSADTEEKEQKVADNGTPAAPGQHGDQAPAGFFDQRGATAATDYLATAVTNPISSLEIKTGDIISARHVSGLTSAAHGIVRAVVTKNVYDHNTGMNILIPQGSQLVGIYQTGGTTGQELVEVGWERVIFPAPCSQSLDLGIVPASDASGFNGEHDITETHFWDQVKALLLASVFSAGIQLSQPPAKNGNTFSSQQIVAGALGQQLGEWGMEHSRAAANIPPVQKIRPGYEFTVMATKDIAFSKPWIEDACDQTPMQVAWW
jgi:type IV secretory pathway VirB10-like protein